MIESEAYPGLEKSTFSGHPRSRRVPPSEQGDYKIAMRHWRSEGLLPLIPDPESGNLFLNFGSGAGGDKRYLISRGFQVVALDTFSSPHTSVVGDGHLLPFPDSRFDIVAAVKVLEHLYSPSRAIAEIARVLKPGGYFIGSVAFLEPFHSDSYFNISHLGIAYLLRTHGFRVEVLFPGWDFMQAFFRNFIPYSYRLRPVFKVLADILLGIRSICLKIGKGNAKIVISGVEQEFSPAQMNRLKFAGSIIFKARKI
jgi:SAM-dependent methyltransferase